ncbi:MAG: hypothetical protein FJ405_07615 [Verrucomicrobia bacterium]|nr:hypothetical protein [Verrucomicrobiota bacterium]
MPTDSPKPKLLVLVGSDPRTSHRPAEAVRIAAGVGAWKKVEVSLYLHGAAVLSLQEFPDELKEDDNFSRYLPIVRDFGRPVYIEKGSPHLAELGETPVPFLELDRNELARLSASARFLMRF